MTSDNPFHYAMRHRHAMLQKNKQRDLQNRTIANDRITKQSHEFNQIQDLKKSSLYKTTLDVMQSNRDKEYIKKNLDSTLNNLNKDQIKNFKDQI